MPGQAGRLITPEAVALDVRRAGPGTRMAARGLDIIIQSAMLIALIIILALAGSGSSGGTALVIIGLVGAFLVVFGYPAIMEALWSGRTLGKAAFGLRVVTKQGAPITFRHAAIRSALWIVDGILIGPFVGVICLLTTSDTVRVGDLAAGTVVLRERSGAPAPAAVGFGVPPGYEHYVGTLDVSQVAPDDYSLVRGFLLRLPSLRPEPRARLGLVIAERIAGRLRLGPQPMPPELFLSCVAAAVQQRSAPAPGPYGWAQPGGWGPQPGPQQAGWAPPLPETGRHGPTQWAPPTPATPPEPARPARPPAPGGGWTPPS